MADAEKLACLEILAAVATFQGDPNPPEFEAFLDSLRMLAPLPTGVTPESLLSSRPQVEAALGRIHGRDLQETTYRGAAAIAAIKGINPQEADLLETIRSRFGISPETAAALVQQGTYHHQPQMILSSALDGMASLIRRERDVRGTIFNYALGAAIVGLIPIRGGGSLEIKLLLVLVLILKMMWDIRALWGKPSGQDIIAIIGNLLGGIAAVVGGFLAWGTVVGIGVLIPYVGALAKAAGFATATWIAGQSTNQFYTSQAKPDLAALKRAFPSLQISQE